MKKIIALMLVVISVFSVMSISVYAEDTADNTVTVTVNGTTFIFDAETSEDFRNKAIANYFSPENDGTAAYGLTCTLLGHKLESSYVTAITHKAKATSPRCLRETFNMEVCTRCDYTNPILIDSSYIVCC